MPTPAKTSREALIGIGLSLVTAGGADALTIAAVAAAAGVKGPSLYKHFTDREALLLAVEISVLEELEAVLRRDIKGRTPKQRLVSLAHVYRRFALDAPHRYGLIYRTAAADHAALAEASRISVRPLFEALEAAGLPATDVLPRARTLVAFVHGFVSMEIAEAFRLGGSVDAAFEQGLETILGGIA